MGYTARVGRTTRSDFDFDELWRRLEDVREGYVGEIVGGEIVETMRPGPPHLRAASRLGALLGGPFDLGIGGPGGWVIHDEPRIRFGDEVRVPDLAGWRRERYEAPEEGPFVVAPDWIGEVLSASTEKEDRTAKMPLYLASGVSWLWLIDPRAQLVEAYRREAGMWVVIGTFGTPKARIAPFDEIDLDVAALWAR